MVCHLEFTTSNFFFLGGGKAPLPPPPPPQCANDINSIMIDEAAIANERTLHL